MSFPSYTNKTDDVDEIQAADINILYTDVAAIARAATLIVDLVDVGSMTY